MTHIIDFFIFCSFKFKVEETDKIFDVALEGLEYYQNYFGSSLKMAITYSHFLWMFFLVTRLICKTRLSPRHYSFVMFDVFTSISIVATAILIIGMSNSKLSHSQLIVLTAAQDLPLQYILFYSLPSVLLWAICRDVDLWWPQVAPMLRKYFFRLVLIAFTVGLGIGCLVSFRELYIFLLF
jgi:Phosphatidylinositolglycan class N (PIG-N)